MPKIRGNKAGSIFIVLSIAILLLIPNGSFSTGIGKDKTIAAKKGKARTISELVRMYDSSSCKKCHPKIWQQWSKSLHAKSIFGTYRTAATLLSAYKNGFKAWPYSGVKRIEDVKVDHLILCMRCHLPQLQDATDNVAVEIMKTLQTWAEGDIEESDKAEETLKSLNINCLICHNRNAIIYKWENGYPEDGVVYGTKKGVHPDIYFNKMKPSPVIKESIFCGQCHGLGPLFEYDEPSQCATLYGSYLFAYRAGTGRKDCQDCHMRESGLGHNIQAYRDPKMVEMAVDFHVTAVPIFWRDVDIYKPLTEVLVHITNRAGHGIPDG